ncbi:MAG: GNAT family N-acetyltransferase [Lachnospiraceae bacterium]|nr:GNAT family N-acetyltransferase [Lachnospiraceae bacterium]
MIRKATLNDSTRIAEIDVTSSRYAYKSIVSEKCLYEDLSVEKRIPVYENWIRQNRFDLYVYEEPETGEIKGMMGIGICEDDDKKDAFELHFLYVDPAYIRMGVGYEMLRFYEQIGKDRGCREYVIWVLEDNAIGKSFYEKNHYCFDGEEKIFKRWNKREIRYVKG